MSVSVSQLVQKIVVQGDTEAKAKLSGMHDAAEKTSGGFKGMLASALSFAGGQAIFNLVGNSVGFLKDQLTDCFQESMDAQKGMAQTAEVIKSTGDASGMSAQQIADMAGSLSHLTTFSDDTIQSGENLLLTFTGIGKDVFPQATKTMLDMAQAMGGDVKSTAIQMGKALNDPAQGLTALTRVGVTFTEKQKEMIKTMVAAGDVAGAQKIMLQELQREFGGSAEAAGKTFGGQMIILKQRLSDVKQQIGDALMPVLQNMMGWVSSTGMPLLEKFGDWFTKVGVPAFQHFGDMAGKVWAILDDEGLGILIASFQNLANTIGNDLSPALKPVGDMLKAMFTDSGIIANAHNTEGAFYNIANAVDATRDAINTAGNILKAIGNVIMTQVWPPLRDIGLFVGSIFAPVWKELVTMWQTQLLPAFADMAPVLQPLGMLLGALAMIVGTVLVIALAGLVGVVKGVVTAFAALLTGVIQAFGGVVQFIMGAVQIISGIMALLVDIITGNWSNIAGDLETIGGGILTMISGFCNVFMGLIGGLCLAVGGFFWGLVTGVIDFFRMLFDRLVGHSIVIDLVNGILNWIGKLGPGIMAAIASIPGIFMNVWNTAITDATNAGANICNGIANGIRGAIAGIGTAIASVTQFISDHLPHSPAKIGPLMHLAEQGASIVDQVSSGMLAGMPKLNTALTALTKPISMNLAPGGMSNGISLPPSYQPSSSSQGDIYLQIDGRTFARLTLPYTVNEIRNVVGIRI